MFDLRFEASGIFGGLMADGSFETAAVFEKQFEKVPGIMLGIVRRAAQREASTHAYQNRTHMLEDSTQGVLESVTDDSCTVRLEMGMQYACYVVGMGLSNIVQVAAEAEDEMLQALEGIADLTLG